jgi:hypothetical protein
MGVLEQGSAALVYLERSLPVLGLLQGQAKTAGCCIVASVKACRQDYVLHMGHSLKRRLPVVRLLQDTPQTAVEGSVKDD